MNSTSLLFVAAGCFWILGSFFYLPAKNYPIAAMYLCVGLMNVIVGLSVND